MNVGLLITVGSITIVGAIADKVLESLGKYDLANKVSIVTKSILGTAVVVTVGKLCLETLKLLQL